MLDVHKEVFFLMRYFKVPLDLERLSIAAVENEKISG